MGIKTLTQDEALDLAAEIVSDSFSKIPEDLEILSGHRLSNRIAMVAIESFLSLTLINNRRYEVPDNTTIMAIKGFLDDVTNQVDGFIKAVEKGER